MTIAFINSAVSKTSSKLSKFISTYKSDDPYLVVDLDIIDQNYNIFTKYMYASDCFYAIKANPHPDILKRLVNLGSSFDTASVNEINMVLAAGASPTKISFGNTIKKETDIKKAHQLGINMFAFDSIEELEKIARAAPRSDVYCRILCLGGETAEWPLSDKFGCHYSMASTLLKHAKTIGLNPIGVSFHVGSQQLDTNAWDDALHKTKMVFDQCSELDLNFINLGGGFPVHHTKKIPSVSQYGKSIYSLINKYFDKKQIRTIYEPGRGMHDGAGIIVANVVMQSYKDNTEIKHVYLDIGKFTGLAECDSIKYAIYTDKDRDEKCEYFVYGNTCDSSDTIGKYVLPKTLKCGDKIYIMNAVAYTLVYHAENFNGFEPFKQINI